jgi:hypothetical protein
VEARVEARLANIKIKGAQDIKVRPEKTVTTFLRIKESDRDLMAKIGDGNISEGYRKIMDAIRDKIVFEKAS